MLLTQPAISLDSIPERRALGDAITPPARRCQVSDAVGEPLVSLAEWGVPTLDAYAELGILPPRDLKVRNHVCARLQSARSVLPEGFDVIVSMASGICPVADSRTAQWRPAELPTGGQVFCPQFSWSVASPPFRRWLG